MPMYDAGYLMMTAKDLEESKVAKWNSLENTIQLNPIKRALSQL